MGKTGSRTGQVLDLIENYINLLDACNMSECFLINDKLIDILHRRFFDEFYQLTGISLMANKKDRGFPIVLGPKCTLMSDDEPINLGDWGDTFCYFIEGLTAPYGYDMNISTCGLSTFTDSYLYINEEGKTFEDYFLNVEQNFDISELIKIQDFYQTMQSVYAVHEDYSIDAEVYMNEMIPAARSCYKQHKNCKLFKKLFHYVKALSSLVTDTIYDCYETENCWYSVFYFGNYNDFDQGWYFLLPADLYLKRLYIDIALQELNRRYQFYSRSEDKTSKKGD